MQNEYVVWSFEHNMWWAPNHRGYVSELNLAGRYEEVEAGLIVVRSVLLEEIAILLSLAQQKGPPTYHPYDGALMEEE